MLYHKGDMVIHRSYGPGEIIDLDEKQLDGQKQLYYVVQSEKMTVWVPVSVGDERSLRRPTSRNDFNKLFGILSSNGDDLPDDRYLRQTTLSERMNQGSCEAVCQVIRDLSSRAYHSKLNENDLMILRRAREFLLNEWTLSLGTPLTDAQTELEQLLKEGRPR